MSSYYVVAQYVPDPVTDERINFGVFAYEAEGDGPVEAHFLEGWERIKCFGSEDISFLEKFVVDVLGPKGRGKRRTNAGTAVDLTPAELKSMAERWGHSIQFTAHRGALMPVGELLEYVASRFLREPAPPTRPVHDRRYAANLARENIEAAVERKIGEQVSKYVKFNRKIEGNKELHVLDVSVSNGALLFAAHGLSFKGKSPDSKVRHNEVSNMLLAIEDIRNYYEGAPIGILVLPPDNGRASEEFTRTRELLPRYGAQMITESKFRDWADTQTDQVAFH